MTKQELIALLQEHFFIKVDVKNSRTRPSWEDFEIITEVTVELVDKETNEKVLTVTSW